MLRNILRFPSEERSRRGPERENKPQMLRNILDSCGPRSTEQNVF
jgi:hypothetical protein